MRTQMQQSIMKARRKTIKKSKEQNRPVNKYLNSQKKMHSKRQKRKKMKFQPRICHKERFFGFKNLTGL